MIKVEIKSQELKRIICNKLNIDSNSIIYESELKNIKDIAINKSNIINQKTDMNFSELIFLTNLESCIISNCEITHKDINILNTLTKLKIIQFTNCTFKDDVTELNLDLKYVIIEACKNLNLNIFLKSKNLEQLRIIHCNDLDMKEIEKIVNIKELYLQNCTIININKIINLKNLQYINLEKSKIDNNKILPVLKEKLKIDYKL